MFSRILLFFLLKTKLIKSCRNISWKNDLFNHSLWSSSLNFCFSFIKITHSAEHKTWENKYNWFRRIFQTQNLLKKRTTYWPERVPLTGLEPFCGRSKNTYNMELFGKEKGGRKTLWRNHQSMNHWIGLLRDFENSRFERYLVHNKNQPHREYQITHSALSPSEESD